MVLPLNAAVIAEKLVPMLLPLLPYLVKGVKMAGKKFAEALGQKSGEKAVEIAGDLWGKLNPKIEQKADAKKLVMEAADDPTQNYLPGALAYQLKEILEDEALRKEVILILEKAEKQGVKVESFIDAGIVYGEVTGVQVVNLDALEKAGMVTSEIRAHVVEAGAKVTGVKL